MGFILDISSSFHEWCAKDILLNLVMKWTYRYKIIGQVISSFFMWPTGSWLKDLAGLIAVHHLPKLQNLPGMWQAHWRTSRCVQDSMREYLNTSVSLLCDHILFSGLTQGNRVLNYRGLTSKCMLRMLSFHIMKLPVSGVTLWCL